MDDSTENQVYQNTETTRRGSAYRNPNKQEAETGGSWLKHQHLAQSEALSKE